jgi:hypothetical protein
MSVHSTNSHSLAEDAELYARDHAWRVFPVHSPTGLNDSPITLSCSCGKGDCHDPGKHPRVSAWQKCATLKPERIEQWWERWPEANIGIATGDELLVVDVDHRERKDGFAALDELTHRYDWKLDTFTVRTGGGGEHLYYSTPPGVTIKSGVNVLGVGLDIRAAGGFVVAPPSLHACGRRYQIADDRPVAPLPEPILDLLLPKRRQPEHDGPIFEGHRHNFLFRYACSLRAKGANEKQILAGLIEVNQRRCVPPQPTEELERQASDVARRYAPGTVRTTMGAIHELYKRGVLRVLQLSVERVVFVIGAQAESDPTGIARLTFDDLQFRTGFSTDTLTDVLDKLEASGLLEIYPNKSSMGRNATNGYRLTPDSTTFQKYFDNYQNPALPTGGEGESRTVLFPVFVTGFRDAGRPRLHKDGAARARAYRERKAQKEQR